MEKLISIKLSNDKYLAILLFTLLYFFNSKVEVELKFVVLFVLSLFFFIKKLKVYNSLLNVLFPLVVIFVLALFSTFFYTFNFYDFIRDSVYLLKPIIAISFGCYFVQVFSDKKIILKTLIVFCFFTSIIHILTILFYLKGEWDTAFIRYIGGKGSELEAFVFSIYIVFLRKKEFDLFPKKFNKYFIVIVLISISLYLSRTTFIAVGIFLISFYGFTQINKTQVIYLFGVIAFFITFMISLQFMNIDREATGVESFFYKLKMAPSEIFDSEIDTSDHSQLWDGWRAYEAKKAFDTMKFEGNTLSYVTGMGLGFLVDLGFKAPLGNISMQFIPHIHNGYVYIFFKSGIIGLLFLLLWLYVLYAYTYKNAYSYDLGVFHKIISGLGLYLCFSTLVITGIYNMGFILSFLLGIVLGFIVYNNNILKNKS